MKEKGNIHKKCIAIVLLLPIAYCHTCASSNSESVRGSTCFRLRCFTFPHGMGRKLARPCWTMHATACGFRSGYDPHPIFCCQRWKNRALYMPIPSLPQVVDTIRGRINNTLCATLLSCRLDCFLEQIKSHLNELCRCIAITESLNCRAISRSWTAAFLAPRLGP